MRNLIKLFFTSFNKRKVSSMMDKTLQKHKKYIPLYTPNDYYWGLGIECEGYIETDGESVTGDFFQKQNPERYSVDYFKSYKDDEFNNRLMSVIDICGTCNLPVLINSHALSKMDIYGEHSRLYKKGSPINPKFSGKTIIEMIHRVNKYLKDEFEKSYTFDGDSVEIITQNFYKATLAKATTEFSGLRSRFIIELKEALKNIGAPIKSWAANYQAIKWMQKNYGIARMITNKENIAIFNNGTYHFNITLPTQLNEQGMIADMPAFIERHRRVINAYQWLEPFLVGLYGTPDILSMSDKHLGTSKASLRGALSRYIGIGTFDTDKMTAGKLLTMDAKDAWVANNPNGWMQLFYSHSSCPYMQLDKIGYDINFNKHLNHGIEFRIFDWFPENKINEVLELLIHTADYALVNNLRNPIKLREWNALVYNIMVDGFDCKLSADIINVCLKEFNIRVPKKQIQTTTELWLIIKDKLMSVWGECSKCMLPQRPEVDLYAKTLYKFKWLCI